MISKLRTISFTRATKGFTLIESLVAIVIVTMVASAAAVGMVVSIATQEDARLAQLATQAAQQQVSFLMEKPFASMVDYAGTEALGQMMAPLDAGATDRSKVLTGEWAKLSRVTTLTSEPITFTEYWIEVDKMRIYFVVDGMRIDVQVKGPDGTVYATIRRHRTNEAAP
jgi:prepilin-type N-terminal cleavage/methylation domain-containing protein